MKLAEVRARVKIGPNRDDAFSEEFRRKGVAAGQEGAGSPAWEEFKNHYFADDTDTLSTLDAWGRDGEILNNRYGTTTLLTSGGSCDTITRYDVEDE